MKLKKQVAVLLPVTLVIAGLLAFLSVRERPGLAPRARTAAGRPVDKNKVEVVVDTGFQPSPVHVDAGKPVTLVVTRLSEKACGGTLLVPGISIHLPLPLGIPISVTFMPPPAGELRYGCDKDMKVSGVLVVD